MADVAGEAPNPGLAQGRRRVQRSALPVHHVHGARDRDRVLDPSGHRVQWRRRAALGDLRARRVAVGRRLDRPALQAHADRGFLLHLRQQRHPSRGGVPGRVGVPARDPRRRPVPGPADGLRRRRHHELGVGLVAGPVVGLDGARLPARVLAGLPRHQGLDRDRRPARCLRDPRVRRAVADAHRPGRQRQHARGVRHALRQQPRLLRLLRGDRGLDLHDPRVHRVRGGGADRGRGARAAADRQPGDHLLLPRDRPLLHPQHLRQHHHVRTGEDDRLRRCR